MKKIERQILSYKLVIASCLIIIMGSVGYVASASGLSDEILDRVAEKIANSILGEFDSQVSDVVIPEDEMLGISSRDELWLNNDSGIIYLGTGKTAGVRISSGVLQSKNVGGTWATLGATTPGDEGFIAYEPILVPATNEQGYRYTTIFGGSNTATSSITNADATTVLVADGGFVTTGTADFNAAVEMDTTLTVDGASTLTGNVAAGGTLAVTGNTTLSGTLTQTGVATFNADPIVAGTTPTLTIGDADAEDTSLVFDGVAQDFYVGLDDSADDFIIGLGSALGTTPAISITDGLAVTVAGTLTQTGAASFASTLNVDGASTVAAITGDGNWLTTGNLQGANLTASGNLTAGGSLYVINSGDNVGVGSSTPFYRLSVVDTSAQLALSYDTAGQVTFGVDASDDLTIVPSGGDVSITGTLAISSTLAVTGASTFTGALTGNGSILVGLAGALDSATAGALSIGTSTATSIEIGDTAITTNIQGPLTAAEGVAITGELSYTSVIEPTDLLFPADVTLTNAMSGTTHYIASTTGVTFTLPAVATAEGVTYKFVTAGAFATSNHIIDSAEGDNIEGSLMVAGAIVDCDAEDQVNIVSTTENLGDFFDITSNGTNWFIGANVASTTGAFTCTDPS